MRQLHHGDTEARWTAAGELAIHPEADAILPEILKALPQMDWSVKHIALWILGELRHADALSALIEALEDEQVHVRLSAARALEKFDIEEAKQALINWTTSPK